MAKSESPAPRGAVERALQVNPHVGCSMQDRIFDDEIRDVVLQLFHKDNMHDLEELTTLSSIEAGVLSWYLGSFYYAFCSEAVQLEAHECFRPSPPL